MSGRYIVNTYRKANLEDVTKMKKFGVLFAIVSVLVMMVVPSFAQDGDEAPSIAGIVVASAESDMPEFTVLLAAVDAAGLVDALDQTGPYTVFAPTDEAFTAALEALGLTADELLGNTELLTSVLLYHVVPGTFYAEDVVELDGIAVGTAFGGASIDISVGEDGVFVDDAQVIQTDIEASNGVIHVIDSVILPSEDEGVIPGMMESSDQSIADIVIASSESDMPEFTVLLAAVLEAGYADALTMGGPFTVFAPTDEAFGDLLAALEISAEDLLADTELLDMVLSYHVVPFPFFAEEVVAFDGAYLGTLLEGYALEITVDEDGAFVDDSMIIQTDIIANNGVIHVIDTVLIPAADDEMEMEG